MLTPDEQACEDYFVKTHSRDKDGRYTVRLPFKEPSDSLTFNGSFAIAEKMLTRIVVKIMNTLKNIMPFFKTIKI